MRAFIASAIIALGALHPDINWAAAGAARQPARQPPSIPVLARRGTPKQSPVSPRLPNRGGPAGFGHFTPLPSKASTAASRSVGAASLSGSNLDRRAPRSAVLGGPAAYDAKQGAVIGGAAMAGGRTPRR